MPVVATTRPVSALNIIERALRLLGVYSIGDVLSAEEGADALGSLNALLDSLSNERLLIHARTEDVIALSAGTASVSVGPSGTVTSDRPMQVLADSYITFSAVDYPIDILTLGQYNDIAKKTTQGITTSLYAQQTMTFATMYLYPVPQSAATLHLWSLKALTYFASLSQLLNLPPGYERMLANMLAVEIAPEYQREPTPTLSQNAANARRAIKRTNYEVPVLDMPGNIPGRLRTIENF